jgi:hypothetical protein
MTSVMEMVHSGDDHSPVYSIFINRFGLEVSELAFFSLSSTHYFVPHIALNTLAEKSGLVGLTGRAIPIMECAKPER